MTLTLALPGVFYTLSLLGGLPLSVQKLRKIERRSKVQRIVRDLNTPIVYSFFYPRSNIDLYGSQNDQNFTHLENPL